MRSPLRHMLSLAILIVSAVTPALARESGVQMSKDGKRTLISKDVGNERWAISLNHDDNTVTGNVFHADGGDPSFLWCQQTSNDGQQVGASCWGADRCDVGPCAPSDWAFIANVTLPASFFALPAGDPIPTPQATHTPQPTATPVQTDSLTALIGTWNFTFTIVSTFTDTYHLQQIVTASNGKRGLAGVNQFGGPVLAARIQELSPGSTLPYEFELLDPGAFVCDFHVFNRTGNTSVSGLTSVMLTDSTGACDPNTIDNVYAMSGVRLSTSALGSDRQPLTLNLDDAVKARGAALIAESSAVRSVIVSNDAAMNAAARALLEALR